MTLLGIDFTKEELVAYMSASDDARAAIESLVGSAVAKAEEFVAKASTDRACAIGQGMLLVALQLRETLRGAPARFAALAKQEPGNGNSLKMDGFL